MIRVFAATFLLGTALTTAASPPLGLPARGSVQVAFSPGDNAGALVVDTIRQARRQVLVQAYSFTHRAIADALIAAHRRGVEVSVIADMEETRNLENSLIGDLAQHGVTVYLDGQHLAAHNKIMVIDPDLPTAAVITGSFNFTHAAQYRNAENLLVLRGNPPLAQAYAANWRRHRTHSLNWRP